MYRTSREPEPASIETYAAAIVPSIRGVYAHGWRILTADPLALLFTGFLVWFVCILGGGLLGQVPTFGPALTVLYQVFVVTPVLFGAAYTWLMAVRGVTPDPPDLFIPLQQNYVAIVLAGVLTSLLVLVGLTLFVIPGIVLAVRLAFVPFLVVDERLGPIDALRASWRRTAGYSWTLLGLLLLGIVVLVLGFLLFVVGSIPASVLVYLTFAALYASATARLSPRTAE